MPEAKTSYTTILGAAAEHYVMCQLLRRSLIAALAPAGVPFADILVSNHLGSALSAVQVKARTVGADGGWHMSSKHEKLDQAFYLYCFVDFGPDLNNQPRCWIVPSGIVAKVLIKSYQAWLHKPGKGGKPHKDHDMRRLRPDYSDLDLQGYGPDWLKSYKDAWHLVAASAPATVGKVTDQDAMLVPGTVQSESG